MKTVTADINEIIEDRETFLLFRKKKILITGSTGLIGSALVRAFDAASRLYGLDLKICAHARNEQRAKAQFGSLSDSVTLVCSEDFDFYIDCDIIFHTASPTKSKYFVEHPVESIDTILSGTKAMLELARKNGAAMVYLSSMEEYGTPYIPGERMTEEKTGIIDHLSPRSCYPEGKRMCECMCAAYASEYGLPVKIARLAQTFGAGIPLTDNRVSMQFARSAVRGENIVLHTEGKSLSNFCYLTDTVRGLLTVAAKGKRGEAYNICNDTETRSIFEIAKLVAEEISGREIEIIIDIPKNVDYGFAPDNSMYLCSEKLRNLGWEPRVSMKEGYDRLSAYLRECEGI